MSSWVELLSRFIKTQGSARAAAIIYVATLIVTFIVASLYFYVAQGELAWLNIIGIIFASACISPFFIYFVFDINKQLQASIDFLHSSAQQEKLLNQSLQDNIKRLNSEIDDRKLAFQAKRRAIDELRREMSERKRTQQELDEQEVLLRSIVDSSPDLFYYRDNNGLFAGCNLMFEKVMGQSRNGLIGKTAEQIYPHDLMPSVLNTDKEVQEKHISLTLDVEYSVEGENRWFEMRKVPFFDGKNNYIGLLGFGRDITSRKQAEQDLETAYKDKGKFIATLSHELRTPLNGIVGLTRMLMDTELTQEQRSWCNTVFSSAETLGNIFNDIIDLDKVDREQLDIACESVNIADFLNDVINFGGLIAQQKELYFNVEQTGVFDVFAEIDPTRLRQVLWNLINNAVKFTRHGGVDFTCVREYRNGTSWLKVEIRDTGIGIAQSELAHIFDLYYKVPDVSGQNALGSGIGLAVTRALVIAMNGEINVTSTPDEGSCFTIEIPLKLTEQPVQQVYDGRSLHILLVEDVPLNAEIATNLLEQRGHEVLWAETGEDALAFIETEDDLDLVLLDMQLPDINGDEVARIVRSMPEFDSLPIVALTANVRRAEQDLEGISMQGSLAKPVNTAKLDKVLAQLFPHSTKEVLVVAKTVENSLSQEAVKVLDIETIDDFVSSMGCDAFSRGVDLFGKLWPTYQSQLDDALKSKDYAEYKSVAHKLKGASGSVGLKGVQLQAKKMEDNAEQASDEELTEWLTSLPLEIEKGLEALSEYLK